MTHRIHPAEPMVPGIEEVIGDPVMMVMITHKDKIEIGQDEESGEEEPGEPERIRNPAVQVVIIPGRRIVGDHRWTLFIVIIVYC